MVKFTFSRFFGKGGGSFSSMLSGGGLQRLLKRLSNTSPLCWKTRGGGVIYWKSNNSERRAEKYPTFLTSRCGV